MTLSADNLQYRVGHRRLVDGASFELQRGAVTAIAGPNGAGKSTLLKLIANELRPDGGTVALNGRPIGSIPHWERGRLLAVLPQLASLALPFTVREVVELGRMPHAHDSSAAFDRQIIDAALAAVGMEAFAERNYLTLSGGERQRAQYARVLTQVWPGRGEPAWMLLDEPVSALDLNHQLETLRVAREMADRGLGVLVVLHDLNLASRFADRLMLLREGRIAGDGPPREVLTAELLGEIYGIKALITRLPELDWPIVLAG